VGFTLLLVLAGLVVALIVYAATGGDVLFLPLLLVLPLGFFAVGRRRR
jgi:hypothetical protein